MLIDCPAGSLKGKYVLEDVEQMGDSMEDHCWCVKAVTSLQNQRNDDEDDEDGNDNDNNSVDNNNNNNNDNKNETVKHIISACPILAKEQYTKRHNRVCAQLCCNICQETGVKLDNSGKTMY